jgi:hypothetical protein
MRDEIVQALNHAKQVRHELTKQTKSQEVLTPQDFLSMSKEELELYFGEVVTEHSKQRLSILESLMLRLTRCIESSGLVRELSFGSPGSIHTSGYSDSKHSIVVEISLYGPLAAVFEYGLVPAELKEHIESCIQSLEIVRLTDSERNELESTNQFLEIFDS